MSMYNNNNISRITHDDVMLQSMAANTRKLYTKGWAEFERYCTPRGITSLEATPEQVSDFFIWIAQQPRPKSRCGEYLAMSSIQLIHSAIARKFKDANLPSPTHSARVEMTMRGLIRIKAHKPRRVMALRDTHIKRILVKIDRAKESAMYRYAFVPPPKHARSCNRTPRERTARLYRDASLLSLGFAAALRRSEIIGIQLEHLEFNRKKDRMILHIPRSKTDQDGHGQQVPVTDGRYIKPLTRLLEWLDMSGIESGFVYQAMRRAGALQGRPLISCDIPRLVKQYGALIGLNPNELSGHSLRAGFVTSAAAHKARLDKIMEVTRHKNANIVMRYIRDADSFRDHAGAKFL